MRRRDWDYSIIAAMFATGLYVTLSGLVSGLFGLHQFHLHRYAGYACAALILVHLLLNRRRITTYLRQRLGRPQLEQRTPPPARERPAPRGRRAFILATLAGAGGFLLGRLTPGGRDAGEADLGQAYHEWSKPGVRGLGEALLDWGAPPDAEKRYPDAPRFALPDPRGFHGLSAEEAVETRRSRREYVSGPLSQGELSRLLHAAQGITDRRRGFRAAPSAGALYPIETYVIVHDVDGLEPGLYHYAVAEHALEQLRVGDLRAAAVAAGIGQQMLGSAQACIVLSALFQRTRWRYRERTYRYVLLEAGHVGQNVYLAATSMGLGACAIGAYLDGAFNQLLGLDGREEAVLYVLTVGKVS
jgi:SagB-type dehydrogenase family enzyme